MSKFKLRPYQEQISTQAGEVLQRYGIVYLAMECRVGKTFTAMQTAANVGAKKVLFLTTKKAIASIMADYAQMKEANPYMFDIVVKNYEDILAKDKAVEKAAVAFVDLHYPAVSKKGVKYKRLVAEERVRQREVLAPYTTGTDYDVVILDEGHKLGALPKPSGIQKSVRALAHDRKIIYLSGTPTAETTSQLYHQLQVSDRSPWAQYRSFYLWAKAGYVNIEEKVIGGQHMNDYSNANSERILADVAHLTLSFTQQEAGFDVKVEERVLEVPMSKETHSIIRKLKRDRVYSGLTETGYYEIVADSPARMLQLIHQVGSGTVKVTDNEEGNTAIITDYTKAYYMEQYFKDQHIAIAYEYIAERELLKEVFGDRVTEDWQEFQRDMTKVFIGQFRSIREGIRLDTAECFVFYNIEWSYVSYEQTKQRIVSKDREKPAIVYFLFSDCGIERKIYQALQEKTSFTTQWYNQHKE